MKDDSILETGAEPRDELAGWPCLPHAFIGQFGWLELLERVATRSGWRVFA